MTRVPPTSVATPVLTDTFELPYRSWRTWIVQPWSSVTATNSPQPWKSYERPSHVTRWGSPQLIGPGGVGGCGGGAWHWPPSHEPVAQPPKLPHGVPLGRASYWQPFTGSQRPPPCATMHSDGCGQTFGSPPPHAPPLHVWPVMQKSAVHGAPSTSGVSAEQAPVAESHTPGEKHGSAGHCFWSWPVQKPSSQESTSVHGSPSSQRVPFGRSG